jgi:exosome complex protein LRP1
MGALDEHVREQIEAVEESLTQVDEIFGNLGSVDYEEVVKKLTPLERAKYDLTHLYAINSLFWMYMRSFGENPQAGAMKEELDRIKKQMLRVAEISNKSNMPRINKEVAGRLVRHELWEPGTSKGTPASTVSSGQKNDLEGENWDEAEEPMETDTIKSRKRKHETNTESIPSALAASSSSSNSDEDEGVAKSSSEIDSKEATEDGCEDAE